MPDFWQFPTGSMGIGPISSIYHARFMRYLTHRGLLDASARKVWGVFGDGEMDEPESMSALTLAAREKPRQPGLGGQLQPAAPRRSRCAATAASSTSSRSCSPAPGWNVIKLVWGSDWDGLFARDADGALARAFAHTVDGQIQTFAAKDGRYNREHFFGQNDAARRAGAGHDRRADRPAEARRPRPREDPRRLRTAAARRTASRR